MTEIKKPCACDYEACREVWKRVAPGEDPYPMADNANTQMSAQDSELTLPGAEADPCCMGSEASVSVEVLQGFLREELGDAQVYAYLSSCTPRREMARAFRALSEDEKRHARDLAAAIYLITGKAYCPRVCVEQPDTCDLCALLRSLYHAEACAGYNYARAGEETLDLCLSKLFAAMSEDEYQELDGSKLIRTAAGRIPPRRALDEAPRAEDKRLTGRKKRSRRNPAPLCCAWVIRSR